jgi:anti-sigma factor RsiW
MRHVAPGDLLELHFGELPPERAQAASAHLAGCAACRAVLADVALVERALGRLPAADPPPDGLGRVLSRIEAIRPAREKREHWIRTVGPCAAALLAGAVALQQGGPFALLAVLAVGSILTLAMAPVLILESQRRS